MKNDSVRLWFRGPRFELFVHACEATKPETALEREERFDQMAAEETVLARKRAE